MAQSRYRISDKVILKPTGILSYFFRPKKKILEPSLPEVFSFLEIDNKSIVLSALKKAEETNSLIVRFYNITSLPQKAILTFYDKFSIKNAELVNLLEDKPKNDIRAEIINYKESFRLK